MTHFQVTPEELHGLASRLSGLLGELSQIAGSIRGEHAAAAGAPQLEAALSGFLSDWAAGMNEVHNALSALTHRLDSAGSTYESTDSQVAGHFHAK